MGGGGGSSGSHRNNGAAARAAATTTTSSNKNSVAVTSASAGPSSVASRFPVNSLWELTLTSVEGSVATGGETVAGRVYCTDEISQMVVLQRGLVHTTLAMEIRMVNVAHIVSARPLNDEDSPTTDSSSVGGGSTNAATTATAQLTPPVAPLSQPLPRIQKKTLEDRERRALRLAEESFKHINQKVCHMVRLIRLDPSHQTASIHSSIRTYGPSRFHRTNP